MNAKAQNKVLSNISGCLKNNVLFTGDCFVYLGDLKHGYLFPHVTVLNFGIQ